METTRQTIQQFSRLLSSLSPSQRATFGVVTALTIGGFVLLMARGSSSDYVALSWGKRFTTEELVNAEQSLLDAGLNEFRRNGQVLLVPTEDVERYNAALLEGGTLPDGWGGALEKQFEGGMGVFESSRTSRQRQEIALAKELQRVIQAVPSIEQASVIWATSKSSRWPRGGNPRVTATVNVRPKRGRELTESLVQSLRMAVAGAVPDLEPSNVTIFDQSAGVSYTADDPKSPFDNGLLKRIREYTRDYETKISSALSYIPDVLVTVNVDVEQLKSRIERIQKVDSKGTITNYSSTRTRDEKIQHQVPRSEPGVRNNQPRSLTTAAAPEENRSVFEEDATSTTTPSFTITEQAFFAAMPKSVQVSIKIPQTYYEAIATQDGLPPGDSSSDQESYKQTVQEIERREIDKAKATASVLIPTGSEANAIDVSSYHVVQGAEAPPAPTFWEKALDSPQSWGGKAGLIALACWGLWMVGKSLPQFPSEKELDEAEQPGHPKLNEEMEESLARKESTARDTLQSAVRDNPDVTAGIIERWIEQTR